MKLTQLNAISPIDGRYFKITNNLSKYFSESALIKYRVKIEIKYFIELCKLPLPNLKKINTNVLELLKKIYKDINDSDLNRIKDIEKKINHDVKAVEYFIKEKFDSIGIKEYKEFIHFGLTSQDINNTAIPLALKNSYYELLLPSFEKLIKQLKEKSVKWKKITIISKTHGQPASPTTMGKEIYVFVDRLIQQIKLMNNIPMSAKFGGCVGNFNAHHVAYPKIDWNDFANNFIEKTLKLHRSKVTSQIDHYDHLAALLDNIKRINVILIDLCKDIWNYISIDYFKQKINKNEVGSSTMPHKVNPIEFENAEGNLGVANSIFQHLSNKLPISRMQRDLTDSTVIRNLGVPIAHTLISINSIKKGLKKLIINESNINSDLNKNWVVIAEGIQTILRREKYYKPYEAISLLTRTNEKITKEVIFNFIEKLNVSDKIKDELKQITPQNYTGIINF